MIKGLAGIVAAQGRRRASAGGDYSAIVLADNPIGYWRLGETSGTTTYDEIASADGTIDTTGVTINQTGIDDNPAMDFDGTSNADIDFGEQVDLLAFGTGDFSVDAWIYCDTTPSNVGYMVMNGSNAGGSNPYWGFFINASAQVGFNMRDANYHVITSTDTIDDSTWHHVAGVRRSNTMYLYVDGVEQADTESESVNLTNPGGTNMYMGHSIYNVLYLNAKIDEVAIYDFALTASQVSTHAGYL